MLKLAEQSADEVPTVGTAELNVTLAIDADDTLLGHSQLGKLIGVQLVVANDPLQRLSRQFDELHDAGPLVDARGGDHNHYRI